MCTGTGDRWQVTGDRWQVTGDRWQVTGDRWQVTGDRWQVTGDRWQVHLYQVLIVPVVDSSGILHLRNLISLSWTSQLIWAYRSIIFGGNLKNTCYLWDFQWHLWPVTLQSTETCFTLSPYLWLNLTITPLSFILLQEHRGQRLPDNYVFMYLCITTTPVHFTKTPFVAGSANALRQLGTRHSRSLQKW